MRKFITSLLILICTNSFGQDWAQKIAKKFYSKVDSTKKMDCCDNYTNAISIDYTYSTYELPFQSSEEIFSQYYSQVIDSVEIETIVNDLVKSYNKIPAKYRNNFTKSCFNIDTKSTVSQGYESELFFVEGKIHFVFSFQMNKPYKSNFFKELFGIL